MIHNKLENAGEMTKKGVIVRHSKYERRALRTMQLAIMQGVQAFALTLRVPQGDTQCVCRTEMSLPRHKAMKVRYNV